MPVHPLSFLSNTLYTKFHQRILVLDNVYICYKMHTMERVKTQTTIVTARVSQDVVEELKDAAAKEKRTLSNYLSLVLENHVEFLREESTLKESRHRKAA